MTARLLFVGDMHLGRRPSRLPVAEDLARCGLAAADLTPAAAWARCVEQAVALRVDALVLAGDVVDRLDDRFEAYSVLRAGVEELLAADIPVFAVAGNHDVEALPRLARQLPDFKLLGAGGEWEAATVGSRSGAPVELLGWSFPTLRVRSSPLDGLVHERAEGVATIGVLHCDVDAGASAYAPVSSAALRAAPVDAWMLGHVHRPGDLGGDRPIGYLGSLVGLDPGEVGRRGPWLVEAEGPGCVRARQLPLAPLRWERESVEIAEPAPDAPAEDAEDAANAALAEGLRAVAARVEADAQEGGLRLVGCRLEVRGPGRHDPAVRAFLDAREKHPFERRAGVQLFVESVTERATPDLDLQAIAAGDDPPGLLARRLLLLERGGPEADALVERATRRLGERLAAPRWRRAAPAPEPGVEVADWLIRAGTRRLEALLGQSPQSTSVPREASGSPGGSMEVEA